jgi:hypothetical protein
MDALMNMPAVAVKRFSIFAVAGASFTFACYVGWLYSRAQVADENLFSMHQFVVFIALATWLVADTRAAGRPQPSFDYGWFVMATLPIYGPYYLVKTRRWRGALMGIGAVLLFLLPWITVLLVWPMSQH